MSIKKLTYRTWAMLDGNVEANIDSRFTYREIREAVRSAVAQIMIEYKFESANAEDGSKYSSDILTYTHEGLDVEIDPILKLKYVDLPCELIPIHDGRSVSIYPDTEFSYNTSAMFLPIRKEEVFINRHQSATPDATMFYVSGKSRVYFAPMGRVMTEEKVNVITRFSIPLNDDQDLSAPEQLLSKAVLIAYQALSPQIKPDDNSTDGVPN